MAAKKRSRQQREHDLVFIAERYLRGWNHEQITYALNQAREDYNLSRSMISRDCALLLERWRAESLLDFGRAKVRELAKIDRLESEAWDAWERSKQDQIETVDIDIDDTMNGSQSYSRRKSQSKTETRVGEVKYLQQVEKCIQARCRILGLDAPRAVNINWRKQAQAAGVDPSALVDSLTEEFLRHAAQGQQEDRGNE